ncbi:MAG: TetR/AcrR family transcriptional regulator [Planctomycetes bacterium]|nr:TetR/AcrR family transcriptional regulator [Planctomycetota bacterium]
MKNLQRRRQLLDAATAVFAAKGYGSASVADIIQRSGVARGTFYLYFDSKADAFSAVLNDYLEGFRALVTRELKRSYRPPAVLRAVRESVLDFLAYHAGRPQLAAVVFREGMSIEPEFAAPFLKMIRAMSRHWSDVIRRLQELAFVRRSIDPPFLATCFVGMFRQMIVDHVIPDPRADLDRLADQWIDFTVYGAVNREA